MRITHHHQRRGAIVAALVGAVIAIACVLPTGSGTASMPTPPTFTAVASTGPVGGNGSPPSGNGSASGGQSSSGGRGNCAQLRSSCCVTTVNGPTSAEGADTSTWSAEALAAAEQSPSNEVWMQATMCYGADGRIVSLEDSWSPVGSGEPPPPSVDDLVPGVIDEATNSIPQPMLAMSPSPEAGGVVNLGMWLAIQAPTPVTARAEAGTVWAQVTATLQATTWDMGNGDVIECDGAGDPIIDPDTTEPSPLCGYTYQWPSAPQYTGTDDLAYHLTVTTRWDLQLTGSDGRNVTLDPIDIPLELTYQVREIQTVGTP